MSGVSGAGPGQPEARGALTQNGAGRILRLLVCLLLTAGALAGCRNEEDRRARRIGELRKEAVEGLEAVHRYCDARDSVVAAFNRREPGWERTLEEVLRGTFALDDYCEEGRGSHEHDEPATDTTGSADSVQHQHQP